MKYWHTVEWLSNLWNMFGNHIFKMREQALWSNWIEMLFSLCVWTLNKAHAKPTRVNKCLQEVSLTGMSWKFVPVLSSVSLVCTTFAKPKQHQNKHKQCYLLDHLNLFKIPWSSTVLFPFGALKANWSNVITSPPAFKILARAPSVTWRAHTFQKKKITLTCSPHSFIQD